jgi:hypothetical protein
MHESSPRSEERPKISEEEYLDAINILLFLAEKLANRHERLASPHLKRDSYTALKQESLEFPEYPTDIDALLERLEAEGARVVIAGSDIFILPFMSTDIVGDGLLIRHFEPNTGDRELDDAITQGERCYRYHKGN